MKTKTIKIVTVIAVIMVLAASAACNRSKANPETDFEFADGTITKYTGTAATVVIPSQIRGQAAANIGANVFADKQLTSVTIPSSVNMIGLGAFAYNQLTSVTIPASVTDIGAEAFIDNQLTSITIGSNVNLGFNVFGSSLSTEFDNIYNINGKQAGTYTFGNGVWAFNGNAITAPQAAEETDWAAFAAMQDAIEAAQKWWDDVPMFTDSGDQVWNYNNTNITATWSKGSLTISGTGTVEGNYNDGSYPWRDPHLDVYQLIITDGITEIGWGAFAAKQLEQVVISGSVTKIGHQAFDRNPLASITLGANVELGEWESQGPGMNHYYSSFSNAFDEVYNNTGKQGGTYFFQNGTWVKAEGVG